MDDRYGTTCSRTAGALTDAPPCPGWRPPPTRSSRWPPTGSAAPWSGGLRPGGTGGPARQAAAVPGPGFLVDGADVVLTPPAPASRGAAAADGIRCSRAPETRAGRPCEPHPGRGASRRRARREGLGRRPAGRGRRGRIPPGDRPAGGRPRRRTALARAPLRACWWITSWRGPRSPGSPTRSHAGRTAATCASSATRTSTCGSASRPARWASRGGRRCRAAPTSRSERAGARLAVETPADLARAWQRILGRVPATATSTRRCSVEWKS